jgi:hypothetical protein
MSALISDTIILWAVDQSSPERIRNGVIVIGIGLALLWLTFWSKYFRENAGKVGSSYLGDGNVGSGFTVVATLGMRLAAVLFVVVGILAVVGVL